MFVLSSYWVQPPSRQLNGAQGWDFQSHGFSWFLYHEASMGRRLWDCHKKSEIVSFSSWFRSLFPRKFWVNACWACAKNLFLRARSKIKQYYSCFWTHLQVSKTIFSNLYTLGIFDLFWAHLQLEYAYLIGSVFKNLLHREQRDRNRCKEDAFISGQG